VSSLACERPTLNFDEDAFWGDEIRTKASGRLRTITTRQENKIHLPQLNLHPVKHYKGNFGTS
jgi:hypothetical protein